MDPLNSHLLLLVEDEEHIAQGLIYNLEQEGYEVIHAATGEKALTALQKHAFSLVILDLMLPDMSGLDICQKIRTRDSRLPVLILTALSEENHRVSGFLKGADDYLTKPFSLAEFLLRVQGMLKRSAWYRPKAGDDSRYIFGNNSVDLNEGRALTSQGEITLTDLEIRILRIFFEREGEVLQRSELLASVWHVSPETETRTLDNFIARLRKYFEKNPAVPKHFLTVRGKGYRFIKEK
jgi:two-component system, OmpR family, alkaline phosphatase synthesis response regulator PhoP